MLADCFREHVQRADQPESGHTLYLRIYRAKLTHESHVDFSSSEGEHRARGFRFTRNGYDELAGCQLSAGLADQIRWLDAAPGSLDDQEDSVITRLLSRFVDLVRVVRADGVAVVVEHQRRVLGQAVSCEDRRDMLADFYTDRVVHLLESRRKFGRLTPGAHLRRAHGYRGCFGGD